MSNQTSMIILVWISLLLSACQTQTVPSQVTQQVVSTPATSSTQISDIWRRNLVRWLHVAYSENAQEASFAGITSSKIDHPTLYATYSIVGVYHSLNEPIESASEIADWIVSLQTEDGAFNDPDPLSKYPALLETNWAVATLARLKVQAPQRGKVMAFLRSLQNQDGFFEPDQDIGGNPQAQKLVATFWVIDTLKHLNVDLTKEFYLESTKEALLTYLDSADTNSPSQKDSFSSEFFIAVHTLALLDPHSVPSKLKTLIQEQANTFSLSNNPAAIAIGIDLLNSVNILQLPISDTQRATLRRMVETELYPSIIQEPRKSGRPVEPMLTLLFFQLGRTLDVGYETSGELLKLLKEYRVAGGWSNFLIPQGDPEATAYALFIACEVGYEDYNPQKVGNFLRKFTQPAIAVKNIRDTRFALRGLAYLNQLPNSTAMQELQDNLTDSILAAPKKQSAGLLLEYALLVYEQGWQWPHKLEALTLQILQQNADSKFPRMDLLHQIAILEKVSNTEVVPKKQIAQEIMQLQVPNSGFKSVPNASGADALASLLAVEALRALDTAPLVNRSDIESFVKECKRDYGYDYCYHASPNAGVKNSTFGATYSALRLLHLTK